MISRVEWLKIYEKINQCAQTESYDCMHRDCMKCIYHTAYDQIDLLDAAAEIFNAQVMANGRLEDDGK